MTSNTMIAAISKRRTQYALGKELPVSKEAVEKTIKEAVRLTPSSFNSQSARAVILFGAESDKLWSITKETLRKMVPADSFSQTEGKINSFAAGAGTILFYEDQDVVKGLQEKFALYAHNFPIWAEQSNGMTQFAVWSSLAALNIGASLQHYNPLIDDEVSKAWGIPANWTLRAQMPFGANMAPFSDKTFIEDDVRFRVFG